MATVSEYILQSTATSVLTTELNGLAANNYGLSSSSWNNVSATANFNGYTEGEVEIFLAAPSATFTANSAIALYFIKSLDGTNWEDSCGPLVSQQGALLSAQVPDYQWLIRAIATSQRIVRKVWIPPGQFMVMLGNIPGSGTQAFASTGNTVKLLPFTTEGV